MPALDGIRVVDLTRLLPGAYATHLLHRLGAQVIKVEDPHGGDGMRRFGQFFDRLNHGKQSVTLDLRAAEAASVLDALLGHADVIVDSFRPSTARRLRVDAATLRARHLQLICASITGFGRSGPRSDLAAHDINYQALAGLLQPPTPPGPLVADVGAAMEAAIGILAALLERQRTATGGIVEITIHDAARHWRQCPTTRDVEGACYALYETADGEWLALGALESKFWRRFCERIGRPEFVPLQHVRDVVALRELMRSKRRDEWLALFDGSDVCLTTVVGPADRADDEPVAAGPPLGADTEAVLAACGIDPDAQARLRQRGVI